ncbi:MAG: hypothetical protein IJ575_07815 [Selenomonadaceae bacterium]|nr:hypothetical protein [Selenomonadaceae bacterium]
MKEKYQHPEIVRQNGIESALPAILGAALKVAAIGAGYAVGRGVTRAMEAHPTLKLQSLIESRDFHDLRLD